jgi:hypothetical protein
MRRTIQKMPTGIPYKVNDDDRLTVIKGLEFNLPLEKIAALIGVSVPTIETHYSDEIAAADLKRGPKPFEPTAREKQIVMMASGVGMPHSDIARLIGISEGSLRTHFRTGLDQGAVQANLKVGGSLFRLATADPPLPTSATAAIWWTKARMGWKETSRVENTGADGKPIETRSKVMILLPDNGRGDCTLPVVQGPISELEEAEDASSPDEKNPPWLIKK